MFCLQSSIREKRNHCPGEKARHICLPYSRGGCPGIPLLSPFCINLPVTLTTGDAPHAHDLRQPLVSVPPAEAGVQGNSLNLTKNPTEDPRLRFPVKQINTIHIFGATMCFPTHPPGHPLGGTGKETPLQAVEVGLYELQLALPLLPGTAIPAGHQRLDRNTSSGPSEC